MSDTKTKKSRETLVIPRRVRFTAEVSIAAYDAIIQIQRYYLWGTGKNLSRWQILEQAIIEYADRHGIKFHE